jgi:hypothetical protein
MAYSRGARPDLQDVGKYKLYIREYDLAACRFASLYSADAPLATTTFGL